MAPSFFRALPPPLSLFLQTYTQTYTLSFSLTPSLTLVFSLASLTHLFILYRIRSFTFLFLAHSFALSPFFHLFARFPLPSFPPSRSLSFGHSTLFLSLSHSLYFFAYRLSHVPHACPNVILFPCVLGPSVFLHSMLIPAISCYPRTHISHHEMSFVREKERHDESHAFWLESPKRENRIVTSRSPQLSTPLRKVVIIVASIVKLCEGHAIVTRYATARNVTRSIRITNEQLYSIKYYQLRHFVARSARIVYR